MNCNDKYYMCNSLNKMRIKILHFILCPGYIKYTVLNSRETNLNTFPSYSLFSDSLALKTLE